MPELVGLVGEQSLYEVLFRERRAVEHAYIERLSDEIVARFEFELRDIHFEISTPKTA